MPDSDRVASSIGTGYTKGSITVDASYIFIKFLEREVTNSYGGDNSSSATGQKMNGKYNSSASLPAITVSYKF